jgi:hypothetical protein
MASMDTTLADALGRFIPLYNTSCLCCTSTNTILPPFLTNNSTANECKCPGVEGNYVCDDSNDVFTNAQDATCTSTPSTAPSTATTNNDQWFPNWAGVNKGCVKNVGMSMFVLTCTKSNEFVLQPTDSFPCCILNVSDSQDQTLLSTWH